MTPLEFLAKKVIKKIGGAQKQIDITIEKFYGKIIMNVECPCFDKGNLTKHKKEGTGALRTTLWYSRVPIW